MSLRGGERGAGISVPLFSLRSNQSWGLGEIGDIPRVAVWLRSGHQSRLQILPLNELAHGESSPYSSLSAMAIDPRYITINNVEDAADFESLWAEDIAAVRATPRIAHDRITRLKHRALEICFERFCQTEWLHRTPRADALRFFIIREKWWLDEYSVYRALRAQAGERPWTEWPRALRDRDPSALADACRHLSREILFHQYVQWIAAQQWEAVRKGVESIEILGDFPFMVTLDSADVWSRQQEFMLDASVGTPPDAFSETGQKWGLPPYNWNEVRKNDFEWLRLRARRMAWLYDGFRVDHLVGFYRTYVRPADGSRPYFSPAAKREQLALGEAVMHIMIETGADVSVEDQGTVPPFVRESVARLGRAGYRVFRWEPADPGTYPARSVAMTSTHDTEPLAVWWESLTPEERILIARMPSVAASHPGGTQGFASAVFTASIRDAILKAIFHSGSNLVLLAIQDVFGWTDRINHPATIGDWNWTYVLPWPVDEIALQPDAIDAAARLRSWTEQTGR
jgi:4-alpha-glucanotransferase